MLEHLKVLLVGTNPETNTEHIYTLTGPAYARAAAEALYHEGQNGRIPFQVGYFHGIGTEQSTAEFRDAFRDVLADMPSAGPDWAPPDNPFPSVEPAAPVTRGAAPEADAPGS